MDSNRYAPGPRAGVNEPNTRNHDWDSKAQDLPVTPSSNKLGDDNIVIGSD